MASNELKKTDVLLAFVFLKVITLPAFGKGGVPLLGRVPGPCIYLYKQMQVKSIIFLVLGNSRLKILIAGCESVLKPLYFCCSKVIDSIRAGTKTL